MEGLCPCGHEPTGSIVPVSQGPPYWRNESWDDAGSGDIAVNGPAETGTPPQDSIRIIHTGTF